MTTDEMKKLNEEAVALGKVMNIPMNGPEWSDRKIQLAGLILETRKTKALEALEEYRAKEVGYMR